MRMPCRLGIPLALALLVACGGAGAPPPPTPLDTSSYLTLETGTLPIVLSAPHGGEKTLPGIPERTSGTTVLDANTLELATAIQARLLARTGRKAHLVAALASRRQVDFNRSAGQAYETPAVAPLYQAYHGALQAAVNATRGLQGPLLVDLHGQSANVSVVYRGTRDGQTADLAGLYASPGGFLAELLARGVAVLPGGATGVENPDFNGGFIAASYGRGNPAGTQALQLEFGYDFRRDAAAVNDTASMVADALIIHLQAAGFPGL